MIGTFDGSTAEFYVNGVSQGQMTITQFHDSLLDLIMSGRNQNTDCSTFTQSRASSIDEVIILQEALSVQEVQKLYVAQSQNYNQLASSWTPKWDNIVGYWKMDGNWQDSSGNGLHGSPNDLPLFDANSKVRSSSTTFRGDGSLDRIDIPHDPSMSGLVGFTVSSWVNFHNLTIDLTDNAALVDTIAVKGLRALSGANEEWTIF